MAAQILDGKTLAQTLQRQIAERVAAFRARGGPAPGLAVVLVGENPASAVYVKNKQLACQKAGLASTLHPLPAEATTDQLLALVRQLNGDPTVHGILVQLPLPSQMDERQVLDAINPAKDVDAFHPENVGRIVQGRARFAPCTPLGVQRLLMHYGVETAGRHAVIVGRSEIVGKPMAALLMQRGPGGDATVTVVHSRTPNLAQITRQADILIVAAGRANMITGDMVKPGAAVVDVGINRTEAGLVGDVEFATVQPVAGWISPVPGGVGPLTVTMLLENCLRAAELGG